MRRADRYIFRQLFWSFMIVTVSLVCVVWLTQSLRYVEMIVNRGLSAPVFVYFTMLLLPTFFSMILPIALFTGLMFTFSKMLMDNELIVLRATGFSHFDLARPVLTLAIAVTLAGYVLTLYLIPASFRNFKDMQLEIRNSYSAVLLQEGVFNTVVPGVTVFVRTRNEVGELHGILVHDGRSPRRPVTLIAETGAIVPGDSGPRIVMGKGSRQVVRESDGRLSLLYFDSYTFDVGGLSKNKQIRWREPRERFLHELFLPERMKDSFGYRAMRMEAHDRLTTPLMALTLVLIGMASLLGGDFNRRGQTGRIIVAVVLVVVVEAAALGVKSMGRKIPELEPVMYLIPLVPIAVCLHLLSARTRSLKRVRRTPT